MKRRHLRISAILLAGIIHAFGCGPFFPDTVLNLPQAALRVRTASLFDEWIAVDRSVGKGHSLEPRGRNMVERVRSFPMRDWPLTQAEWDRREQLHAFSKAISLGLSEEVALKLDVGQGQTRDELVDLVVGLVKQGVSEPRIQEIASAFVTWRNSLPGHGFAGPFGVDDPPQSDVRVALEFPEVSEEIEAYWNSAALYRSGRVEEAKAAWRALMASPLERRVDRGIWAAWMLAKTSATIEEALPFYEAVAEFAEEGCLDALGLVPLALGWRAAYEADPVRALLMYFEAACSGDEEMFFSADRQVFKLMSADADAIARAAEDELCREIVTSALFARMSGQHLPDQYADPVADRWLSILQSMPAIDGSPAAANAAWICYRNARFDDAQHWLSLSPPDAYEVLWLRAKLAIRDGKLDQAARLFSRAARTLQLPDDQYLSDPREGEMRWHDFGERRTLAQGQFLADRAIVHIGRGEFLRAMDFLSRAGYHADAAYLAERVLTVDELVGWVKQHHPVEPEPAAIEVFGIRADGSIRLPNGSWARDRYRYLLARRLAREFRFREAMEFMPTALRPVFSHYVKLHRALLSGDLGNETKGLVLWHMAKIRRKLGMELFGYEGAPDNANWDGGFSATDFAVLRSSRDGWRRKLDENWKLIDAPIRAQDIAVPAVSKEELVRLKEFWKDGKPRFHYRYDAAELACRAAALFPDNHPNTLHILHEGGRWIASRDPFAADRFYQEIVRRCGDTELGKQLDRLRWFLPEPPPHLLPELPTELQYVIGDVALLDRGE
jgi:tetratricopeptide (TPR) repeat protein